MTPEDVIIQCQVKLKLTVRQEQTLEQWLWHLTGVYNWANRKMDLDARDGYRWSKFGLKALLTGHAQKMGMPWSVLAGTAETAWQAWQSRFKLGAGRPKLKGARNRLNSIAFSQKVRVDRAGFRVKLQGLPAAKFHKQVVPDGHVPCARAIKRPSGWYLCLMVYAQPAVVPHIGHDEIGIDPGFASLVTFSTGEKVGQAVELARSAQRLAQAQRGHDRRLTSRLHERIGNQRKDRNHRLSRRIVSENAAIYWSKDPTRGMARRFGKSVSSAGHSQLRSQLAYKCRSGGRRFVEVPSRNSTRTCSACGALTGPTGWAGLKVRLWDCGACGAHWDRDINAALNTLKAGQGICHERTGDGSSGIASRREVHPPGLMPGSLTVCPLPASPSSPEEPR